MKRVRLDTRLLRVSGLLLLAAGALLALAVL